MAPTTYTEKFDHTALKTIVNNWEELKERVKDSPWEGTTPLSTHNKPDPLIMMNKILARSQKDDKEGSIGLLPVEYAPSKLSAKVGGGGRKFAKNSVSLQCAPKEIRSRIAGDLYYDIDVTNCHPTLMLPLCEASGLACPALKNYVAHRDELVAKSSLSKEEVKEIFFKVMYGGKVDQWLTVEHPWIEDIQTEIKNIVKHLMQLEKYKPLVQAIAKDQKAKKKNNIGGSFLSHILCEMEDTVLMAAVDWLQSQNIPIANLVLIFDGLMLPKSAIAPGTLPELLRLMSKHVKETTGWSVNFVEKPMDTTICLDGLDPNNFAPGQCVGDDTEAARLVVEKMCGKIVLDEGVLWVKTPEHVWTNKRQRVDIEITRACQEADIKYYDEKADSIRRYSTNARNVQHIKKMIFPLLPNTDDFANTKLWEGSMNKLFFADGVYDFVQGKFRPLAEETEHDMTAIRLPRNFPKRNEEMMRKVREEVLLSTFGSPELTDNFLGHSARAMAGHVMDKAWLLCIGERDCGKGVLCTILETAFGRYVMTINSDNFLMERDATGGDADKKMGWLLDARWSRLLVTNEISFDATGRGAREIKVNGNVLKRITSGGDTLSSRRLYCEPEKYKIQGRLMMMVNDLPAVAPADALQTVSKFVFPFKFVDSQRLQGDETLPFWREKDETIKARCGTQEYGDAFLWLVLDAYQPHPVQDCDMVQKEKLDMEDEVEDENAIMQRYFNITGDTKDCITSAEIEKLIQRKSINMTMGKMRDKLKKMGVPYSKKCIVDGKEKRGFRGVQLVKEEEDEEGMVL